MFTFRARIVGIRAPIAHQLRIRVTGIHVFHIPWPNGSQYVMDNLHPCTDAHTLLYPCTDIHIMLTFSITEHLKLRRVQALTQALPVYCRFLLTGDRSLNWDDHLHYNEIPWMRF